MRTTTLASIALAASIVALPVAAFAATYGDDNLPYNDINGSWDRETRVAISALTDANILQGNPDGSFAPNRTLNRAEFMQIAMRALNDNQGYPTRCFPDVPGGAWYEEPVCHAKALGIISGNALPGLRPDQYPFQPSRPVQYEEALKVLINIYALPMDVNVGGEWYMKYIRAAVAANVELPEGYAGMQLTRAQMARLTAGFLAYSRGELDAFRDAQGASMSSRSSTSSSRNSSSSTSSTSSRSSFSSSSRSLRPDPNTDTSMGGHIILLGTTSPVLGQISIYSNNEPVDVTKITVYMGFVESIDAVEIYRSSDRGYLGRATFDQNEGAYVLRISSHLLEIDRKASSSVYVRAIVNADNAGGWSGESVIIDHISVEANGIWSNTTYGFSTSDFFPESLTARAKITAVENDGSTNESLAAGQHQEIGRFRIAGTASDSEAGVMLQTLEFQINKTSEVTLSNAILGATDTNATSSCSVASGLLTCTSIPATLGDVDDGERTIIVYADVAISGGNDAILQLILNDPGGATTTGSITWNDTEAVFTWVDTSDGAVRGTLYTR